jgi:hypothetical protein
MLLCHGENFKSSSKYNTCSIFFWIDASMGTVAASGNNQHLVLFIDYTLHIVPIYLIIVMILPLMGPWLEINTFVFVFMVTGNTT